MKRNDFRQTNLAIFSILLLPMLGIMLACNKASSRDSELKGSAAHCKEEGSTYTVTDPDDGNKVSVCINKDGVISQTETFDTEFGRRRQVSDIDPETGESYVAADNIKDKAGVTHTVCKEKHSTSDQTDSNGLQMSVEGEEPCVMNL